MTDRNSEQVVSVTTVARDWTDGDVTCDRCDETFTLYFNDGELDGHTCKCGRRWSQQARGYDLIMRETAGQGV